MKILLWINLFVCSSLLAANHSLPEIRQLYKQSAVDEYSCNTLIRTLQEYTEQNNPLLAGYKACGTMMMANYVWSPIEKLSTFDEGKNLLEKCIQQESNNVELRFLRYTIQNNAPFFLGYHQALKQDKAFLLQAVPTLKDKNLQSLIVDYLRNNTQLSPSEKQQLKIWTNI